MKCHQILTGAANRGDRTFAVGSVEGVPFTVRRPKGGGGGGGNALLKRDLASCSSSVPGLRRRVQPGGPVLLVRAGADRARGVPQRRDGAVPLGGGGHGEGGRRLRRHGAHLRAHAAQGSGEAIVIVAT